MALTAAITIIPSGTVRINQALSAQLTITNGNAYDSEVLSLQPYAYTANVSNAVKPAVTFGEVNQIADIVVPASGTLVVPIPVVASAASTAPAYDTRAYALLEGSSAYNGLTTRSYTIGCNCYFADGTSVGATEATVTVAAPNLRDGR